MNWNLSGFDAGHCSYAPPAVSFGAAIEFTNALRYTDTQLSLVIGLKSISILVVKPSAYVDGLIGCEYKSQTQLSVVYNGRIRKLMAARMMPPGA